MKWTLILIFIATLLSCNNESNTNSRATNFIEQSWINPAQTTSTSTLAKQRKNSIKQYFKSGKPFLFLSTENKEKQRVQSIIAASPSLANVATDPVSKKPYLLEMFEINKATKGDISKSVKYSDSLYQALLYNYPKNLTYKITVNLSTGTIVDVNTFELFQPNLNSYHEKLAIDIAINDSTVLKALGYQPDEKQALMAATKTALNKTKCERSLHLCCAPTFVQGEKALWAIVDLTELRLIGIRWTNLGDAGPSERISERNLLIDKVEDCNCKAVSTVKKGDWNLDYILTKSDGLRISDAYYKGIKIISNAKLVDWHVSYSNSDGFGYSDAIGCPEFSQAAVTAVDVAKISEIVENNQTIGFALEQTFKSKQWPQPCNYNYLQRFEFYTDGRFRISAGSLGRGCGSDGTYRPVFRIVLEGEKQNFAHWDAGNWKTWRLEGWKKETERTPKKEGKYIYRIGSSKNPYLIEPSVGQFNDGGRGDFAYAYVTKNKADEGQSDLMTIGPCCNTNHEQGPEKFIDHEPVQDEKIVFWYVPEMHNEGAKGREYCWAESYLENGIYKTRSYPCMAGPMFVPTP